MEYFTIKKGDSKMKCALCNERKADKKNTHYLTDGIIRSCLNEDGSNKRERGSHFNVSTNTPFVEYGFQRSTSPDTIIKVLGREPTGDEIEKAKNNTYSVDNVFCSHCESIFSEIETVFMQSILPSFRCQHPSELAKIEVAKVKDFRLFMYIQVWRTSICSPDFALSQKIKETLRNTILNYKTASTDDLNKYPLSVTYMETIGDALEYTRNLVGHSTSGVPYVIFMNDFVIQLFENEPKFDELYGINDKATFANYINCNEKVFKVKMIHNKERLRIVNKYEQDKAAMFIKYCMDLFKNAWQNCFKIAPSCEIIAQFAKTIPASNGLNYTKARICELIQSSIIEYSKNIMAS